MKLPITETCSPKFKEDAIEKVIDMVNSSLKNILIIGSGGSAVLNILKSNCTRNDRIFYEDFELRESLDIVMERKTGVVAHSYANTLGKACYLFVLRGKRQYPDKDEQELVDQITKFFDICVNAEEILKK